MEKTVSVVIPVYKNLEAFCRNLKINLRYFRQSELVIVNDCPEEDIEPAVKKIAPSARIINHKKNLGFGLTVNDGIRESSGKIILLLNSDVILRDSSFLEALPVLKKDPSIFALSFAQIEADASTVGHNSACFLDGFIYHRPDEKKETGYNFWAEGGAMIFRKETFVKVGMFDGLYRPFYWEDIDLSYRAWKMGYRILYFPTVKVEHHHESTIGKYFKKNVVSKIAYRNQFIFHWKNITDSDMVFTHLIHLPKHLLTALIKGNRQIIQGFFLALPLLPEIVKVRNKQVKLFIKSDRQILNIFKK